MLKEKMRFLFGDINMSTNKTAFSFVTYCQVKIWLELVPKITWLGSGEVKCTVGSASVFQPFLSQGATETATKCPIGC